MNLIEDIAATWREDGQPLFYVLTDLVGRARGQHVLRITPSAPEHDLAVEFRLQPFGLHIGR